MTALTAALACVAITVATAALLLRPHGGMALCLRIAALVLPIAQLMIVLLALYEADVWGLNGVYMLGLVVALVFCGAGDVALLKSSAQLQGRRVREERLRAAQVEEKASEAYAELVSANSRKTADLCGKLSAELIELRARIEDGESPDFEQVEVSLNELELGSGTAVCANKTANAVLALKAQECRSSGVTLTFEGGVPAELGVDDLHLCSVLANLIDNAREAVQEAPEGQRRVRVACTAKGAYLVIRVVNGCPCGEGETDHSRWKRAAKSGLEDDALREHGWGLEIVGQIAQMHEGSFSIEQSGDEVVATAVLKGIPKATA